MATRFGAFVESTYEFDIEAFGISSNEASPMDPQQRILLEETLSALHMAGLSSGSMLGSNTGKNWA